jgi:hypothetical protein
MRKAFLLGLIVGLGLVMVAATLDFRHQRKTAEQTRAQEQLYQAEIGDATPVRTGVLDDRQRLHSQIAENLRSGFARSILETIAPYRGKRIVCGISIDVNLPLLSADTEPPASYFRRLVQVSDAVIRGKVTNKVSNITEDEMFLFTDYDVQVEEVFKDATNTVSQAGGTITVTCAGGKVLIDDVIVTTSGNAVAMLPNDHEILLFLTRIPGTSDFKLVRLDAAFDIDGQSAQSLAGRVPESYLREKPGFLELVRTASRQ